MSSCSVDGDFPSPCASRYHDSLQGVCVFPHALGPHQRGTKMCVCVSSSMLGYLVDLGKTVCGSWSLNALQMCSDVQTIFLSFFLGLQKVSAARYQSTREFTHDTEWILHNCIIYNGGTCTYTVN